jgi:recombination protein RecA
MPIDSKFISSVIGKIEGAASGTEAKVDYWLDSGNYALNKVISGDYTKGLPFGRVVEVFGDPSTGKSLLIYHWIAAIQKMGGVAILDDTEDAYTDKFGKMLGIDSDALIRLSSLTVEEHFEKVFLGWKDANGKMKPGLVDLIWERDKECPILIALDSLALLSTRHEQEVMLEKPDMSKAKQIRAALRNSARYMKQGNILHIVSNHVTSKIGVMFGNPRTTPGGTGMPFSASVRVELMYTGKIKDPENTDKIIGVMSRAKGSKNRVAIPFQEADLDIYFDRGVDPLSGLLENMTVNGIAKEGDKRGYIEVFGEQVKKSEFKEYIKSNVKKLSSSKPVTPVTTMETPKAKKS